MKKKLIALAVFAAVAAPAMAADVTVYGKLNVPVSRVDSGTVTQIFVGNGAPGGINTGNRLGFRGTEDLGGGTSAFFQIETGFTPDDATATNFGSREAWVGVQNSKEWGKFGLGRGKSPYTNLVDVFDGYVDGFSNLAINKDALIGTLASSRLDNAIRYDSPRIADAVTVHAMYGFGENKTTGKSAASAFSTAVRYTSGPVLVGLAYNKQKNPALAGSGAGASADTDNTGLLLAGTYKIDSLTLGAGYQWYTSKTITTGVKRERNSWLLSAAYDMDDITLKAGLIAGGEAEVAGNTAKDSDSLRYTVGLKYNLSKRTSFYTEYSGENFNKGLDGTARADLKGLTVGLMHDF
jgi:predicted porin